MLWYAIDGRVGFKLLLPRIYWAYHLTYTSNLIGRDMFYFEITRKDSLEHLQEFTIFYLVYLVFCQLLKRYAK